MSNKCSLCGKDRVVVKTKKEKVGSSYVFYREMSLMKPKKEVSSKVNN